MVMLREGNKAVKVSSRAAIKQFLLHALLPKEKGPDDETNPLQLRAKLVFQRTVNDVMALESQTPNLRRQTAP